jgi:hypothetical protein
MESGVVVSVFTPDTCVQSKRTLHSDGSSRIDKNHLAEVLVSAALIQKIPETSSLIAAEDCTTF